MEVTGKKDWSSYLAGTLIGFFLQKVRIIRYKKQLGAPMPLDMAIVKFMISTVLIAMGGTYLLNDLGLWLNFPLN